MKIGLIVTIIKIKQMEEKIMDCKITCIPGDGIGPEIVAEAKKVLQKTAGWDWRRHYMSR